MLRTITGLGLMAFASLACGGAAMAAPDQQEDEIVVTAPRALPLPAERSPYTGAPIATASVAIPVLYEDLDLGTERDRERLMTRIDRVAQDACRQLDRMFPLNPDADCVRNATSAAKSAANAMLSARQAR
ncbi:UrcA family protein [Novosphingobium sp. M1R2S20]|uniref:UrcA family protein n=1 Tax=Novosphingobium rhizovicinum TaxID=3228928 RepID=A0ABV3RA06_9SPHN